jgi:hypothetical protein
MIALSALSARARAVPDEPTRHRHARGFNGPGRGYSRENVDEPPGQYRLACPERAKEKEIMGRTPKGKILRAPPATSWLFAEVWQQLPEYGRLLLGAG